MFRLQTAPAIRPTGPITAPHRRQRYPLVRRDPRRFARGMARPVAPAPPPPAAMSDLRRFAHNFGAAFLFVAILIG